jgi:hypothetical protein
MGVKLISNIQERKQTECSQVKGSEEHMRA